MEFSYEASGGGGPVFWVIWLAVMVLMLASMWKIFTKAGKPGWGSIVPIYNLVLLLQIAGKPVWWILLFFIPIANLVAMILVYVGLAARFGKSGGYAVGLLLLPIVFFPMLAFGSATYGPPPPPIEPAA